MVCFWIKIVNANGTAIKFADGLIIQYGKIKAIFGENTRVIFPISFTTKEIIINLTQFYNWSNSTTERITLIGKIDFTFALFSNKPNEDGKSNDVFWKAIGF